MAAPAPRPKSFRLYAALWLVLLALLPWWLGVPLLLALASILLVSIERLGAQAWMVRAALRWGLPGMLLALPRALGGDVMAWGVALLGVLVGYTLLAGLEAWLDRDRRRASPSSGPVPEWPELALAPAGPGAAIIELQPPRWRQPDATFDDGRGDRVQWRADGPRGGHYRFADGTILDDASGRCCFSPHGRWFAVATAHGLMLWDRDHGGIHRLRGWQLWGWQGDQPWLSRGDTTPPQLLKDVLGQIDAGD